jgi:hypothetical protein
LTAAGLLAAGAMFAGEHGDSMQVGHKTKMACTISLADLNLTPEQYAKFGAECH